MSIQQESKNLNTNQSGRKRYPLAAYLFGNPDLATGDVRVKSPRTKTPYRVNVFRGTCDCPGFATHGKCHHTDLTAEVGGAIWRFVWERADASVTPAAVCPVSLFNDPTLTDSEAESDFRQAIEAETEAMMFQVLWGGLS